MHFSQNEDFFLKPGKNITVPHLRIHHNINKTEPDTGYMETMYSLMEQVLPMVSLLVEDTYYYFDPAEPLRPVFFRLYEVNGRSYLYMVRLDLAFKPHDCEILEMGNNDITHVYETGNIFLDLDILPVEAAADRGGGRFDYTIRQSVSQTWIGETGRGYFVQGIWMDSELTRFFSKLFIPGNILSYPYYPFSCKYRTMAHFPLRFGLNERMRHISILDRSYLFLDPFMREIEAEFRNSVFSPDMKLFRKIKEMVPAEWYGDFSALKVKRYLNSNDMKEYELLI